MRYQELGGYTPVWRGGLGLGNGFYFWGWGSDWVGSVGFFGVSHGGGMVGWSPSFARPTSAAVPRPLRTSVPPFVTASQGISAISNLRPFRGSRFV